MSLAKIMVVAGARPNFMKVAPILEALRRDGRFRTVLVHTGQHYGSDMSDAFFRELGLPEPDRSLGVGSGSHAVQTARVMIAFEKACLADRPDLICVVGDVNSTLAAALTAAKLGIPVAHVEAGMRSFDRTMPEEINRVLTDQVSDLLFITSPEARRNLIREGHPPERIHFVGNVMIDTLLSHRELALKTDVLKRLGLGKRFAVATLHRPSNVDSAPALEGVLSALAGIARMVDVVFPVHPRTVERIKTFGLERMISGGRNKGRILAVPPMGYLDFLHLLSRAILVLTDSGGIQEETTILNVPCLTIRTNTERPITVSRGTNRLVGNDPRRIVAAAAKILVGRGKIGRTPKYWDGKAASRIVKILGRVLGDVMRARC